MFTQKYSLDRGYLRRFAIDAGCLLLSVLLLFYFIYHAAGKFQGDLETTPTEYGTAQKTLTAQARLFRDETPLFSALGGSVYYQAADGERVAAGDAIATVYASGTYNGSILYLEQLEREIALLTEAGARAELLTNLSATDTAVMNTLYSMNAHLLNGRWDYALRHESTLLLSLSRRQLQLSTQKSFAARIAFLQETYDRTLASLSGDRQQVIAKGAGYYYRQCDGYETTHTSEALFSMTVSAYRAFAETAPATGNYAVGKIAQSLTWYAATTVDRSETGKFSVNREYPVSFPQNGNLTLQMRLESIVTEAGQAEALLIFSCETLPASFTFFRNQQMVVAYETVTGLEVPLSAIRYIEGHTAVYISFGGKVLLRSAEIIDTVGSYCYISDESAPFTYNGTVCAPLSRLDLVITAATELYPGKVYR